jgi:hypothetical protein
MVFVITGLVVSRGVCIVMACMHPPSADWKLGPHCCRCRHLPRYRQALYCSCQTTFRNKSCFAI